MKNFKIKDALLNIINSEECVKEILTNNNDKIYLYAKNIENSNKDFNLEIDSKNCIVGLNEKTVSSIKNIIKKHNLEMNIEIATVSQIRSGEVSGVLFSAGVIAKNDDNDCLMLERDSYAPTEANCWQFPAGRCEEIEIIKTAKAEITEEISVIDRKDNSLVSIADNIEVTSSSYVNVDIYVDNILYTRNNNFAVMDNDFNTLEQFYFSKIKDNGYLLKDNEFDRKVSYVSFKMLKNNEIKMINLLNKKKEIFIDLFKRNEKKKKLKLNK
jgi:hypothetical protein